MLVLSRLLPAVVAAAAAACHTARLEHPALPPVTVTATPAPSGIDYTQRLLTDSGRMLKKRLAVARFDDNIPVEGSPFGRRRQVDIVGKGIHVRQEEVAPEPASVSALFTEKLVDALSRTNRFVLVERKDINAVLREASFGESKWVDRAKSARIGKILGAQIILTGAYGPSEDPETGEAEPLALFLRMYDVETSRIVGTARASGSTEREVIERAVSEIVARMDAVPWTGKIASVAGDKIFLNAGSTDNVKAGDRFNLFSLGGAIRDPDSGEVIGYEEEPAGKAEVVAVSERVSTLRATEASRPIKVGDKAQPAE